jgi:hypothetical protein
MRCSQSMDDSQEWCQPWLNDDDYAARLEDSLHL